MSTQQDINAIREQRFANTHNPLALMANTQTPVHPDHSSLITYIQHPQPNNNFVPQSSLNTNYLQHPMQNLEDISNPTTALDMALKLMAKAFQLNNSTPTNNNQRSSSNHCNSQIAQSGMNMDQDRHMLMVDDNVGNQFRQNAVQNVGNLVGQNAVQNQGIQNIMNQNGLSVNSGIANQHGNGNVVAARAEGNGACEETKRANANCTLENNLQQTSTSGTQSDKAPVYDSDGSAEVHLSENCHDNDIFNMFTQEEQYTELLEPIPEPHQVQQNDINVISTVSSVEQGGGTVEQHSATIEETLEKVNSVNRKMKESNADLTTELARYKNQEKCFEISQEKYDKLERCYQKSVYQEQCLTKKINSLHLSSGKHDPPAVYDSEETLELAQEYIHNWSSSVHQEIHKIVKDEIFPIVNQVDARVQNFEIQFLKEAAKFVRDFKSLAKEADESLAKHKALELEIERLLRAVVSQDIMSIVQNNSVVDTSNLQTELERTKERFENCIIKKENEYAKLWNDWYKKCEECKYDKISYDKAYNDMQQKIERLQAQLGDQKGKSKDTSCVSNTLDPLSQKLENENVELEFQVQNYEKENAHLKTAYKNLFDSIKVTRTQTKAIIDSLQDKLHDTIYENAKLRAQLFDKVSEQKDTTRGTSTNTQFAKQSILGKPPSSSKLKLYSITPFPKSLVFPKVGESALSKPVTSNSVPITNESTVVNNERVIAPGIFRRNPFKASRLDNFVPNKH
ncbi:hypothetical protein Tco_0173003, partial [Tanacetum coccineum]